MARTFHQANMAPPASTSHSGRLFPVIRLWLILGLACLSGCSSLTTRPPVSGLSQAGSSLMPPGFWRMEGRIGIQSSQEAWSAHIVWIHERDQDRLLIHGPLHQGLVSIVLRQGLMYIHEGRGEGELSRDPEQSLRQRLGFSVPLYSLRYWLMGLPDPHDTYTDSVDTKQPAAGFDQAGWSVRVEDYTAVAAYRLPGKMKIQGKELKLKLVVDHWNLEDRHE